MDNTLIAISDFFSRTPRFLLRFKWLVLITVAAISVFMAVGIFQRTSMDMSMEGFLHQEDPAIKALNSFREQFGSDDSVFLVYRAKDGNAFSETSLAAAQALTEDLENWQSLDVSEYLVNGVPVEEFKTLHHIRRIQSLATIRVQTTSEDTLRSDRLVDKTLPTEAEAIAAIREKAMQQDDGRSLAIAMEGKLCPIE